MSVMAAHVLLVGDTIVDVDIYLKLIGVSLESPTLKTEKISRSRSMGGAAAVACHLAKLFDKVTFVTSTDAETTKLLQDDHGIDVINSRQKDANIKTLIWVAHGGSLYKCLSPVKLLEFFFTRI
ncbi:hypothetical protein N9E91_03145 [Alphaproteobacteria bacterium]|nr:hypothetical protein [Alphaproteobacteria bacterium]